MLKRYEEEGVAVAELEGTLDAATSPQMREALLGIISGAQRVVVDLSRVERVFSSGLSLLLAVHRAAETARAPLVFCGARPFLREILRITMLDRIFRTAVDVDQAVEVLREGVIS